MDGSYKPLLWSNDSAETLSDDGQAFDVFADGNGDVFVVGTENVNGKNTATVWVNGSAQALSNGTNTTNAYAGTIDSNGNLYIAGSETENNMDYTPILWVNEEATVLSDNYGITKSIFIK